MFTTLSDFPPEPRRLATFLPQLARLMTLAYSLPPVCSLGDAHIVRFGFPGALDGFCVA